MSRDDNLLFLPCLNISRLHSLLQRQTDIFQKLIKLRLTLCLASSCGQEMTASFFFSTLLSGMIITIQDTDSLVRNQALHTGHLSFTEYLQQALICTTNLNIIPYVECTLRNGHGRCRRFSIFMVHLHYLHLTNY